MYDMSHALHCPLRQSLAADSLTTLLQAAAAAAEQAQAAAESSAVQAAQAQQAAQGVARALLASKRAEIEAADLLEKPKNPKDADPAAADLLKVLQCCCNHNWQSVWLRIQDVCI